MLSSSGVAFVLFCFVFVLFLFFTEAAALRSIVLRYSICMHPDSHTQLATCLFGDVAFSEYLCTITIFLFVWRVRRTFFPSGWCFPTLCPRAGFFTSAYVRIQSINKIGI